MLQVPGGLSYPITETVAPARPGAEAGELLALSSGFSGVRGLRVLDAFQGLGAWVCRLSWVENGILHELVRGPGGSDGT